MNENHFWDKAPFTRIFLPFITGIFVQDQFSIPYSYWMALLLLSLILLVIISFLPNQGIARKGLFGILLLSFFTASGAIITYLQQAEKRPDHYLHLPQENIIEWEGYIAEPPIPKKKTTALSIDVNAVIYSQGKRIPCQGRMQAYLSDLHPKNLNPGTRIRFTGKVSRLQSEPVPWSRDYAAYAQRKGIFHQILIQAKNIQIIPEKIPLIYSLSHYKYQLIQYFRSGSLSPEAYHMCAALVLGYDEEIDSDTMKDYSENGTIHILSVSGMHVGIIYLLLQFLFSRLDPNGRRKKIHFFFISLSLWLFAGISGFSPAVLRAAFMFTLHLAGLTFFKNSSSLNMLPVSAFFLLLISPQLLFDIGFQLSYTAVAGILLLHGPIYRSWTPKNKMLDKTWSLCSLSIAAQTFTLPLCLYYFHQFPIYFLFGNLVIVPLSGLILYIALAYLIVLPLPYIGNFLAMALDFTIGLMNSISHFISHLPLAVIRYIYFDFVCILLLYSLIVCGLVSIYKKSYRFVMLSLGCCLLLLIYPEWKKHQLHSTANLYLKVSSKQFSLSAFQQGNLYFVTDQRTEKTNANLDLIQTFYHPKQLNIIATNNNNFILRYQKQRILFARQTIPIPTLSQVNELWILSPLHFRIWKQLNPKAVALPALIHISNKTKARWKDSLNQLARKQNIQIDFFEENTWINYAKTP